MFYLLLNCGAFLAFFSPYFLLSFTLESLVKRPFLFNVKRTSGSVVARALAIPWDIAPAWPTNPPPFTVATTSYFSIIFVTLNGFNTIAFNEKNSKENSDLDLLSELKGDDNTEVLKGLKEEVNEELTKDEPNEVLEQEDTKEKNENEKENEDKTEEISEDSDDLEKTKLMDSFYTSSNSLVKKDFEDDTDFAKEINNGNTIIKIIIVIVAIIFAIGLALLIKALFFS